MNTTTTTEGNGAPKTPIATLSLAKASTIWFTVVAGAAFVSDLISQFAPLIPPRWQPTVLYIGGIASAIAHWRNRVAVKQAAQESATVAASVAADVATVTAASVPPVTKGTDLS